ncbi:MAG: glycosyltransferase, partial [Acidobacteriota bacterium]|nr:glycosyltransferase [Acidobacteriota bacterium]
MRISIIVPTLDEQECITGTLRNLQQLEGEKEIIVVDGGSRDETRSLARMQEVEVLTSPPGRGMQMHVGALKATGDV